MNDLEKNLIYRNRRYYCFEKDRKRFNTADYAGGDISLYSGGKRFLRDYGGTAVQSGQLECGAGKLECAGKSGEGTV